jgi:hypothetical protein
MASALIDHVGRAAPKEGLHCGDGWTIGVLVLGERRGKGVVLFLSVLRARIRHGATVRAHRSQLRSARCVLTTSAGASAFWALTATTARRETVAPLLATTADLFMTRAIVFSVCAPFVV